MEVLDSRPVAPFRNHNASNATRVESQGQILHFLTPCTILGKSGEMYEWILRVWPTIKPLVCLWWGVSMPSGSLESGCQKRSEAKQKGLSDIRRPAGH